MTKKQFDKLSETLYKRGYRRYNQHWHHEDYVIGKGFHKEDNPFEEDRNSYQILISVYDYSDKNYSNLRPQDKDYVGLEVHIGVSRTIGERVDMIMAWHDNDTIKGTEKVAEAFYEYVQSIWPEPREYN